MKLILDTEKTLTDDEIIEKVRLELIKKLECVLADLKGESSTEPKQDFDHTFIYIYESDWRRNFTYTKKVVQNTKIEYEYNRYFNK